MVGDRLSRPTTAQRTTLGRAAGRQSSSVTHLMRVQKRDDMTLRKFAVRLMTIPIMMSAGLVAVVAGPAAPALAADCEVAALYSKANNRYVSAELGYTGGNYGMLRARATTVGSWERFVVCFGSASNPNDVTIRSTANNLYVAAELDYYGYLYGMLRARASSAGSWETFRASTGGLLTTANYKFVSVELNYANTTWAMLRSRSDTAGPWEQFELRPV